MVAEGFSRCILASDLGHPQNLTTWTMQVPWSPMRAKIFTVRAKIFTVYPTAKSTYRLNILQNGRVAR